jgi:hypothetical protein
MNYEYIVVEVFPISDPGMPLQHGFVEQRRHDTIEAAQAHADRLCRADENFGVYSIMLHARMVMVPMSKTKSAYLPEITGDDLGQMMVQIQKGHMDPEDYPKEGTYIEVVEYSERVDYSEGELPNAGDTDHE